MPLVAIGSKPGAASVLTIVRSMPVRDLRLWVATLLVSSASKIALFGSTVTVFGIGPRSVRATRTIENGTVDSGGTCRRVHVTTLPADSAQRIAAADAAKLSKTVSGGS